MGMMHKHESGDQCCCCGHGMGQAMHGEHQMGMHGKGKKPMMWMGKKATKKLLITKMEVEIDKRYGKQFDRLAKDMVNMMADKMKMKGQMMKKKMEMKEKMMEDVAAIFAMD